jgi:hypothetical protein
MKLLANILRLKRELEKGLRHFIVSRYIESNCAGVNNQSLVTREFRDSAPGVSGIHVLQKKFLTALGEATVT